MLHAAGLDSADLISQLRASHAHDAASRQGVDVLSGGMGDMNKLGIFESFKVRGLAVFNYSNCLELSLNEGCVRFQARAVCRGINTAGRELYLWKPTLSSELLAMMLGILCRFPPLDLLPGMHMLRWC